MSEPFHIFNTGNRKKFLDGTKKKKEKVGLIKDQIDLVIKLQKNIRKYLHLAYTTNNIGHIQTPSNILFLNQKQFETNPYILIQRIIESQNKTIILKKLLCILIRICHKYHTSQFGKQIYEVLIGRPQIIFQMMKMLPILLNQEKIYLCLHILPLISLTQESLLALYDIKQPNKEELGSVISYILADTDSLLIFISNTEVKNEKFMIELWQFLQLSPPIQRMTKYKRDEATVYQKQIAYHKFSQYFYHKTIPELEICQQLVIKISNTLYEILNTLFNNQISTILNSYQIDQYLLKSERESTLALITEQQQWIYFIDFLSLNNPFIRSLIQWFIHNEDVDTLKRVSPLITLVVQNIKFGLDSLIPNQLITVCFDRINRFIKIYQIQTSETQQIILLAYFTILNSTIFSMDDINFVSEFKHKIKLLEVTIKDTMIKLICKIIFIHKPSALTDKLTVISINLLEDIYNKIFRTRIVNTKIFINEMLAQKLQKYKPGSMHDEVNEFIKRFPFIFPLISRLEKFREFIRDVQYQPLPDGQDHNIGSVKIRRGKQFQDAFNQLHKKNLRSYFQIKFINAYGIQEQGIDAGGLKKQFINRVLKSIFASETSMFIQNKDMELLPHPHKTQSIDERDSEYYEFVGGIIGKALYEGITIGPKFAGPFLNILIGKTNTLEDLRKIDRELYNSLTYMKNMEEDASELELTFQYKDEIRNKYINLKPQGHKLKVTNENKNQYIYLLANYKVNKLLWFQSRNILKGIKKLINQQWFQMFNYEELSYLISGSGSVNVQELQFFTKYQGYNATDITIKAFWSVINEFNEQEKSNLLMFVTSSPRPSFLGFKDLNPPFTVVKNGSIDSLPISHTCVNILKLPDYKSAQLLKEKLLKAISSGSGFQFA